MTFRILITPQAQRALKKLRLSATQHALIIRAIDSLATDPYRGYALRKELKGFYKLRVGDYRIVYDIRRRQVTVVVIGIGHRRDVYETLARKTRLA